MRLHTIGILVMIISLFRKIQLAMNSSIKRDKQFNGFLVLMLLLFGCSRDRIDIPEVELFRVVRDTGGEMFMVIRLTNRSDVPIYLLGEDFSSFALYSMDNDKQWVKTYWGADVVDFGRLNWYMLDAHASCEQKLRMPTACLDSPWYLEMFTYQRPERNGIPDGPILKSRIYIPTKDQRSGRYLFNKSL